MNEEIGGKLILKTALYALFPALFVGFYISGVMNAISARYPVNEIFTFKAIIGSFQDIGFPTQIFFGLFAIAFMFFWYLMFRICNTDTYNDKLGRGFRIKKNGQYGEAHFEDPKEFKDSLLVQKIEDSYGPIFGQIGEGGTQVCNMNLTRQLYNNHILVVGSSGSGKSYTFSKPFLYQCMKRRESIILTDPDGGLYRDTVKMFQNRGYVVRRFDISKSMSKSDGWQCLSAISRDPKKMVDDSVAFCHTVMSNLNMGKDIHANAAESLLRALIMRVLLAPESEIPEEEKTLIKAYRILQDSGSNGGIDYLEKVFNPELMGIDDEKMVNMILDPFRTFKMTSPNLLGNIMTTLSTSLQSLQGDGIRKILTTDDIDLVLPGKVPCVYYVIINDKDNPYPFISSLFFTCLVNTLSDYADSQKTGRLEIPVNFLLEELANIGIIPGLASMYSVLRKRGINIAAIVQTLGQLEDIYEKSAPAILASATYLYSLSINDPKTAKYFQDRIGEATIAVATEKVDTPRDELFETYHSQSQGAGKRFLMSAAEIQSLDKMKSILIMTGHNPVLLTKYPYVLHPYAAEEDPVDRSSIPDIDDDEGRKLKKEQDEKIRREFYAANEGVDNIDRKYKFSTANSLENSNQTIAEIKNIIAVIKNNFSTSGKKIREEIKKIKTAKDDDQIDDDDAAIEKSMKAAGEEYEKPKEVIIVNGMSKKELKKQEEKKEKAEKKRKKKDKETSENQSKSSHFNMNGLSDISYNDVNTHRPIVNSKDLYAKEGEANERIDLLRNTGYRIPQNNALKPQEAIQYDETNILPQGGENGLGGAKNGQDERLYEEIDEPKSEVSLSKDDMEPIEVYDPTDEDDGSLPNFGNEGFSELSDDFEPFDMNADGQYVPENLEVSEEKLSVDENLFGVSMADRAKEKSDKEFTYRKNDTGKKGKPSNAEDAMFGNLFKN